MHRTKFYRVSLHITMIVSLSSWVWKCSLVEKRVIIKFVCLSLKLNDLLCVSTLCLSAVSGASWSDCLPVALRRNSSSSSSRAHLKTLAHFGTWNQTRTRLWTWKLVKTIGHRSQKSHTWWDFFRENKPITSLQISNAVTHIPLNLSLCSQCSWNELTLKRYAKKKAFLLWVVIVPAVKRGSYIRY